MVKKLRSNETSNSSRRDFLKVAGAGSVAATFGAITLSSTEAAAAETFDAEYDIVVCGGGGGRPAGGAVLALARQQGHGAGKGGDAGRNVVQGGLLVLGAQQCRHAQGRHAGRQAALPALRRTLEPAAVLRSQASPLRPFRVGNSMCEAIYDSASVGTELLSDKGALPYRHVAPVPDYFAEMETIGATGRVLFPKDGAPSMSDGRAGGDPHPVDGVPARRRDHQDRSPRAESDPQRQGRGHRRRGPER